MIRQKRIGVSVFVLIGVAIWLMTYSLVMPARTMETIRSSLNVFVRSVLPPLTVFSVCAKLLIKTEAMKSLRTVRFSSFLDMLGMSAGGFTAFLVGLFAGFPTGAAMLSELCEKGEVSESEAESLLPFCNQASVSFLFGTVGAGMLNDSEMGFVFFTAQTVTAWICICLTSRERCPKTRMNEQKKTSGVSFISVFVTSIRESAFSMIGVCGFVVFFSLIGTVIFDTLSGLGFSCNQLFCAIVRGGLEISSGFLLLSEGDLSRNTILIFGGILLGFGGISVFMQATERTEAFFFSPGKYFKGKLLSSIICPIFSVVFFFLYERKNGKSLILIVSIFIFCIFYLLNYVKIKFFLKKCGKMKRNAV